MSTSTGEILGSGAMVSPNVAKPNKMLHPAGYANLLTLQDMAELLAISRASAQRHWRGWRSQGLRVIFVPGARGPRFDPRSLSTFLDNNRA